MSDPEVVASGVIFCYRCGHYRHASEPAECAICAEREQFHARLAVQCAEMAQLRAMLGRERSDSMVAHLWFAAQFGDAFNGRDFAVKCPMADREMAQLRADLKEALDALEPFGAYTRMSDDLKAELMAIWPATSAVFERGAAVLAKHRPQPKEPPL